MSLIENLFEKYIQNISIDEKDEICIFVKQLVLKKVE
jgi:hypothetical protein